MMIMMIMGKPLENYTADKLQDGWKMQFSLTIKYGEEKEKTINSSNL